MSRRPRARPSDGVTRRRLLIGGGAGIGLVVAWAGWPRGYAPNLVAEPGEVVFGPFLKIGSDGHVVVVSPQAEMGQGVFTTLPQIVADELGADWRTVGVEPAPINPLYANRLFARELAADLLPRAEAVAADWAVRATLMVTGSSTVRSWEGPLRDAGAVARSLLCQAAAARWGVAWEACDTADGFVVHGTDRLRFGALVAEAATFDPPAIAPLRMSAENRLTGQSLPRLDLPSKVDGSALFTADVRLPDMVFASVRQAPGGDSRLVAIDRAAAERVRGVRSVVETPGWVAVVATNWWAANRGLEALGPRFETRGRLVDDATIDRALAEAMAAPPRRIVTLGEPDAAFAGRQLFRARYRAAPALHAAPEPMAATARFANDRLELWLPTQAPAAARRAAAAAIGVAERAVTLYPMLIGGAWGAGLDTRAAAQAAVIARAVRAPVQLTWSRVEDLAQDRARAPALAELTARLVTGGRIEAWHARIAAPSATHGVAGRLIGGTVARAIGDGSAGDPRAVDGAAPPYRIAHVAVDHHPADIGVALGQHRGGGAVAGCFFSESFVDELASAAGVDPFSYRIAMLGASPRLARCLSTLAASAGWRGGGAGSGQGIACFSGKGSHIAVLAEARAGAGGEVEVTRLAAVADIGRVINPDVARQQIEGGLMWGLAAALGTETGTVQGLGTARRLGALGLPTLAGSPDTVVELVASTEPSGGASELGVPPVAPAIANALVTTTGARIRHLPLVRRAG